MSRRHARLRLLEEGGTATLEDLQSTNGTFIGRKRVKGEVTLNDGDTIKVGPVELHFRLARAEQPPTKRIRRR